MDYRQTYGYWLSSADPDTRRELEGLSDGEIYDRFYTSLSFGTGGLRGLIGAGTNRMNRYTVGKATAGFARYIKERGEEFAARGVVIAHDNRLHSDEFALRAAGVLAANGIPSYLWGSLRPTPELSYAVRTLGAAGGIMITASHNPPEYNGYKVYDETGCQLTVEPCERLIALIRASGDELTIPSLSVEESAGLIREVPSDLDEEYYSAVAKISLGGVDPAALRVVYSPQHGTGNVPVRTVLKRAGYDVVPVEEQCEPDPMFSHTKNPNPETPEAYELALRDARRVGADLAIATDPDCDRLGAAVRQGDEYILMTGNQSGAVLLQYIITRRLESGTMPPRPVVIDTVVTSDLGDRICEKYGVAVEKTLTGFKFIGERIHRHELAGDRDFLFGYEESYGYLISDLARDKDAVQSSLMLCEAAAYYKARGKTLYDVLREIYAEFGYYRDALTNVMFRGADGAAEMSRLMEGLRENPPAAAGGVSLTRVEDFLSDETAAEGFPRSNVLKFHFSDDSWVTVRPSGTEPKCKFYYCVKAGSPGEAEGKLAAFRAAFEPGK